MVIRLNGSAFKAGVADVLTMRPLIKFIKDKVLKWHGSA